MTSMMADLGDLCGSPTAPESFMNDHEQNSMVIRTFTEALQVCDPNPITHEPFILQFVYSLMLNLSNSTYELIGTVSSIVSQHLQEDSTCFVKRPC